MTQLSVIVPFSNVAPYADQTLRSLERNAAPGIEFILVDDASTDETPAILAEGADRLPDVQVITQPVKRGVSAARNVGLDSARGRYLTFVDGDDVVAPGYLSQLLAAIERLHCDFVRTDHVQVRGRDRSIHRVAYGPRGVVASPRRGIGPAGRQSSVDAPNVWAGISDRRLLDSGVLYFDETLRTCEDRSWIWRLHLEADSFAVVGLLGVRYRREVTASLTQIADERQFDFIPAFEGVIARVRADQEADRFMPKAIRSLCAMSCHHLDLLDRYTPPMAAELKRRISAALGRLPGPELDSVVARLGPERSATIKAIRAAA